MSTQLTIPSTAQCAKCSRTAQTAELVYTQFGLRFQNGMMSVQPYCKSCRRQTLSKEAREKFANFKESINKQYEPKLEKLLADFKVSYKYFMDDKDKSVENLRKEYEAKRDQIADERDSKLDKKRQELGAPVEQPIKGKNPV